jgi:hypothetical protein
MLYSTIVPAQQFYNFSMKLDRDLGLVIVTERGLIVDSTTMSHWSLW